jgi:hypothetical protein
MEDRKDKLNKWNIGGGGKRMTRGYSSALKMEAPSSSEML